MSTRIGLICDVHASPSPVEQAMAIFERKNVTLIICGGDIAGYNKELLQTVELLRSFNCESIIGNHDQSYLLKHVEESNSVASVYLQALPETLEYQIEDKRVYVVHAHPPDSQHGGIKLLDVNGEIIPEQKRYWEEELKDFDHDVLIVGHTHQVFAEILGNTLVINPGSSAYNHSCAILSLPEMTVEFFALSDMPILKSWNWGMIVRDNDAAS